MNETQALLSLRSKYQAKIALIDETLAELGAPQIQNGVVIPGKRTMSQAGREKIAAIARARWAKAKAKGKNAL